MIITPVKIAKTTSQTFSRTGSAAPLEKPFSALFFLLPGKAQSQFQLFSLSLWL
jgi:hypothetical protein